MSKDILENLDLTIADSIVIRIALKNLIKSCEQQLKNKDNTKDDSLMLTDVMNQAKELCDKFNSHPLVKIDEIFDNSSAE